MKWNYKTETLIYDTSISKGMPSYKESGVDFGSVGKFRDSIIRELRFRGKRYRRVLSIGNYAGLAAFSNGYLALHTDGVGTKTLMALKYGYFDEIGYDLVGMNVNDIVCVGADPIAMVEYFAGSIFDPSIGAKIGKSVNKACKEAGISMIGGETASVPDLVRELDLSGTVAGFVKKGKEVTGRKIREGDRIIALSSSGIHSNGFSLIRKIYSGRENLLEEDLDGYPLWKKLLKGTRIYSKKISELREEYDIHGLSHITGGGISNILRLKRMRYSITLPDPPAIFRKIMEAGSLSYRESYQVFNMGVGFVVISSKREADSLIQDLASFNPAEIGTVSTGAGVAIENLGLSFDSYY